MGYIISTKMAADLFLVTVYVFLSSFPILTVGQSNRTVFSPSSTSGNSAVTIFGKGFEKLYEFLTDLIAYMEA